MTYHVLVRPFPYRSPDRLVRFNMVRTQGTGPMVSPADFRDWSTMSTSFENMAAYRGLSVDV